MDTVIKKFFGVLDIENLQEKFGTVEKTFAVTGVEVGCHMTEICGVIIHHMQGGEFDFVIELLFTVVLTFHTFEDGISFPILYNS